VFGNKISVESEIEPRCDEGVSGYWGAASGDIRSNVTELKVRLNFAFELCGSGHFLRD
jgi:hypothetical protein